MQEPTLKSKPLDMVAVRASIESMSHDYYGGQYSDFCQNLVDEIDRLQSELDSLSPK